MKILSTLIVLSIFITVFSCSEKKTVDEEKLIKVYADLLIIQDTTKTENYSLDSVRSIVLKRYDLTFSSYNEMINELNQQPEKWEKFFDKAIAYVNELKVKSAH